MVVKPVVLVGAAVHTRQFEAGKDYDWYVKKGDLHLFEKMDEIYRVMLRDVGGEAPRVAVIIDELRVGFMIGELPSPRRDHGKRVIYDTLYLELSSEFHRNVLHAAVILLIRSKNYYRHYRQYFTCYAERLFSYSQKRIEVILKTVKLPSADKSTDLKPIEGEKLVFFSNPKNRYRCARQLVSLEYRGSGCFCFVSTGRVNLEKCQNVAEQCDFGFLLTLSSEVVSEVNLKKGLFSRFLQRLKGQL